MNNLPLSVSFVGATTANKNVLTEDLRGFLQSTGWPSESLTVVREQAATQDAGTILTIVLSSGAALALAKGLATFVIKAGNRISVTLPSGESVVITGDAASQNRAAEVIAAALRHKRS